MNPEIRSGSAHSSRARENGNSGDIVRIVPPEPRIARKTRHWPLYITVICTVLAIGTAIALLVSGENEEGLAAKSAPSEDPLALYQVATELFDQQEYEDALTMVRRARQVTAHARALRQLNELEGKILTAMTVAGNPTPTVPAAVPPTQNSGKATAGNDVATQPTTVPEPTGTAADTTAAANSSTETTPELANTVAPVAAPAEHDKPKRLVRRRMFGTKGTVIVNSDAAGDVLIDGRATGQRTPTKLVLTVGTHTVAVKPFSTPGQTLSKRVVVRNNKTSRVDLTLPTVTANKTSPDTPVTTKAKPKTPIVGVPREKAPAIGFIGSGTDKEITPSIGFVK